MMQASNEINETLSRVAQPICTPPYVTSGDLKVANGFVSNYNLQPVIVRTFGLSQSDHIKRFLLYI